MASFTQDDYAPGYGDSDTLEIWVNRPRQYLEMIQRMADTDFTERTGIKVNFEWAAADGMDTLLASKVSSKDLPDVISGGTAGPAAINDLISKGLIVPITEYLDTDLANYGRLLTERISCF